MALNDYLNKENGIIAGAITGGVFGTCYLIEKARNFFFGNPLEAAIYSMKSDMAEMKNDIKTIAGEKAVKEAKKEAAESAKEEKEKTAEPQKAQ